MNGDYPMTEQEIEKEIAMCKATAPANARIVPITWLPPIDPVRIAFTAREKVKCSSRYLAQERLLVEAERALATRQNGHLGKLADRRVNK